ncbi:MAG: hypothetical protein J0L64_23405 [Acidobacteria bacterium]|nr:hypothetical protein [Acidobacteriota bacterium]
MPLRLDLSDAIVKLRLDLISELDRIYRVDSFLEVSDAAESIDSFLQGYVVEVVADHAPVVWKNGRAIPERKLVLIDAHTYEIRVGESVSERDVVEVSLVRHTGQQPPAGWKTRRREIALEQGGRYRKARLLLPYGLPAASDYFAVMTSEVFSIGYRWLREKILGIVGRHQLELSRALYSRFRMLVPNPKLQSGFWFSIGSKDGAYYLVDSRVAEAAIRTIDATGSHFGSGSLRLATSMLSAIFPEEDTFSGKAFRARLDELSGDLPTADYARDLSLATEAEIAAYGSEAVTVFPVVASGIPYLIASFPTEKKDALLPILRKNRSAFETDFLNSRDPLRTFAKSLTRTSRGLDLGKLGELFGGMLKSYLSP